MSERIANTTEGQITYETVVCTSCHREIAKENAMRSVVGELRSEKHHPAIDKHKYRFSNCEDGWLCNLCHDDPAEYAERQREIASDMMESHGRLWHLKKFIFG